MADLRTAGPFQVCGSCKRTWPDWEEFVKDPGVRLLGLQASEDMPEFNLLVFEHRCGSSISILARRLRHVLTDPQQEDASELLFGTARCHGHCRRLDDLAACDNPCVNARDRRLILLVQQLKNGLGR